MGPQRGQGGRGELRERERERLSSVWRERSMMDERHLRQPSPLPPTPPQGAQADLSTPLDQ